MLRQFLRGRRRGAMNRALGAGGGASPTVTPTASPSASSAPSDEVSPSPVVSSPVASSPVASSPSPSALAFFTEPFTDMDDWTQTPSDSGNTLFVASGGNANLQGTSGEFRRTSCMRTTAQNGADQWVEMDVSALPIAGVQTSLDIILRGDGTGLFPSTHYRILLATGLGNWYITMYRRVSGTFTQISTTDTGLSEGTAITFFRGAITGDELSAVVNANSPITATDANIASGDYLGFIGSLQNDDAVILSEVRGTLP